MIAFIIIISLIGGIAILANPFIGLLAISALIPLSIIPAMDSMFLGLFTALTPIKIVGGVTFVSAFFHQIAGGKRWDFLKEPTVAFYAFFLVYVFINGFAFPSSFTRENFTFYVSIALLAYLVLTQVTTEKRMRLVLWGLLVSAFVVSIHAITNYTELGSGIARSAGWAFDPNYFAISLLPLIAISFYNVRISRNGVLKIFSLIMALVLLGGFAVSQSRGGFAGLAGMLLIALFTSKRKFPALVVILLSGILIMNFMPEHFWQRFAGTTLEMPVSADVEEAAVGSTVRRLYLAKAAWAMFLDNPIFGVGLGNYYWDAPAYYPIYPGRAHNMYLEILAEMGIVGFVLFMGMLVSFIKCLRRLKKVAFPYNMRAQSFFVGHMGFFIAAMFLHAQQEKGFWLIMFLAVAMERIWKAQGGNIAKDKK